MIHSKVFSSIWQYEMKGIKANADTAPIIALRPPGQASGDFILRREEMLFCLFLVILLNCCPGD